VTSNPLPDALIERDLAPLLTEHLRAGQPVRFRAEGRSMAPFLKAGDVAIVEPLRPADAVGRLRPGDVLLYEPRPGVLRLHRFSRLRQGPDSATLLRVRGDAPGQPAELIAPSCVLGLLSRYERQGREHDARRLSWRFAGLWWPRLRNRLPFARRRLATPQSAAAPFGVLVAAVRDTLRQSRDPAAADMAPAPSPRALVALAKRHGVLALCAEELSKRVPAATDALRDAARALAFEGEDNLAAIAEVLSLLATEGLRPVVVKGAALGVLAYGNPLLRPFDDVDVLLAPAERATALRLLESIGWRDSRGSPPLAQLHLLRTTEDLALRHPAHFAGVELIDAGGILRAAEPGREADLCLVPFELHGTAALAPGPVEHFLYCAAHGGKHGWTRLVWLADLDRLASGFSDGDWDRVVALAKARRLTRLLALGCILAESLLGTPCPPEALGRWRGSRWLRNAVGRCRAWQDAGVRHAETWHWWLALQDDFGRQAGFLARWLFKPTGADFRTCLLPLWAHPLYGLLRPLRLFLRLILRRGSPDLAWTIAPGAR
jgi:hypothetical protein